MIAHDTAPPAPAAQKHVLDYLRVLHKRRVPALLAFLLIAAAGAAYIWTASPVYEARVQLMIETERPRVVVFKDTVETDTDKADYQQTQHRILMSRGLAARVMESLSLWQNEEFTGAPQRGSVIHRVLDPVVEAGAAVVARFSAKPPPPIKSDDAANAALASRAREIDAFLRRLSVAPIRNSRLVDVKFRSGDAKLAADIVNALADAYIKQNLDFKSKSSKEASDWLAEQLEAQRAQVLKSEGALQKYREQTDAMSTTEREAAVQQKVAELNTSLTRAQTERTQKEYETRALQALAGNPKALDASPIVSANPQVQAARAELVELQRQERAAVDTLGAKHPDLIKLRRSIEAADARLRTEQARVVQTLQTELQASRAQENILANAIESQKSAATAMRRKQIEYDALEREAASDRQIFDSLLQRAKETGVSGDLMASNIRVVDAADIPHSPISPQKGRDMAIVLGVALVSGVLAAFVSNYLDKRIKTPDELKQQLGLPCLGLVPLLNGYRESVAPLLTNDMPALFQEAFRAVRTSVLFASLGDQSRTLLVTSTGPHEGKSLIATNLAVSLAQTGRRVLLVDADMRRPTAHSLLSRSKSPGLSGLNDSRWRLEAAVQETGISDLFLVGAGETPSNPAELLASQRFEELVTEAACAYDWVVIDSPPVMAVTDAALIAHLVSGVVFVVGSEQTSAETALNALEKLHAAHGRFVGAVLNRVRLERDQFFYAHHYRREYQKYYGLRGSPNATPEEQHS
jgi:capsular exopolysaccharide synthesis family protein